MRASVEYLTLTAPTSRALRQSFFVGEIRVSFRSVNFKARLSALLALILSNSILVFEWAFRARFGTVHPMVLIVFGAAFTLSLTGVFAPAITQPTADGKLSPLAHKIGLVGFAIGGAMWFWLH